MLYPRDGSLGPPTKVRRVNNPLKVCPDRIGSKSTLRLGAVAGPIFCIILVVDCLFFQFLEWFIPRDQLDFVDDGRTDGGTVFDRSVNRFACRTNLLTKRIYTGCGTNITRSAISPPVLRLSHQHKSERGTNRRILFVSLPQLRRGQGTEGNKS